MQTKWSGSSVLKLGASAGVLVAAMSAGAWAGCVPHDIDLGDGMSLAADCAPLAIAFLSPGTNNEYLQASIQGVQDAAAKVGATVEVFDAGWDAATQMNQAQNILSSGKYNAIIAEAVDGNQACKAFSEDALAANILVTVKNQPLCGRTTNDGDALWAPGTLNYVGGSQGVGQFTDWLKSVIAENPGPQKVAVFTGPDLNANTINMDTAIASITGSAPDFNIIANVKTNYTVADGNEKATSLLQANPDITVIIVNYSDITRGVVQAVQQAGLGGKVKIYDNGGNKWAFQAVEAGDLTSTRTLTPYVEGYKSVEALAAAWNENAIQRYVPLESELVNKDNVATLQPGF